MAGGLVIHHVIQKTTIIKQVISNTVNNGMKVTNRDLSRELSESNHLPKTSPIRGFMWFVNKTLSLNYSTGAPLRCCKDIKGRIIL